MKWCETDLIARDTAVESVPLDLVRAQVRSTVSTENELLRHFRGAAEATFERLYGATVGKVTRFATYPKWPTDEDPILLPHPPLISVDEVTYYDADGAEQTLATPNDRFLITTPPNRPARLYVAPDDDPLPNLQERPEAIRIEYTAGYASSAAVPPNIKQGLLWLIALMWLTRNPKTYDGESSTIGERPSLPRAVRDVWAPFKVFSV